LTGDHLQKLLRKKFYAFNVEGLPLPAGRPEIVMRDQSVAVTSSFERELRNGDGAQARDAGERARVEAVQCA